MKDILLGLAIGLWIGFVVLLLWPKPEPTTPACGGCCCGHHPGPIVIQDPSWIPAGDKAYFCSQDDRGRAWVADRGGAFVDDRGGAYVDDTQDHAPAPAEEHLDGDMRGGGQYICVVDDRGRAAVDDRGGAWADDPGAWPDDRGGAWADDPGAWPDDRAVYPYDASVRRAATRFMENTTEYGCRKDDANNAEVFELETPLEEGDGDDMGSSEPHWCMVAKPASTPEVIEATALPEV